MAKAEAVLWGAGYARCTLAGYIECQLEAWDAISGRDAGLRYVGYVLLEEEKGGKA